MTAEAREAEAAGLVVAVDTSVPAGWDDLVVGDPDTDFFHTELWIRSLVEYLPGHRTLWVSVRQDDRLVGGLAAVAEPTGRGARCGLRRIVSSLDGTAGGPLIAGDLDSDLRRRVVAELLRALTGAVGSPLARFVIALNPEHEVRYGPWLNAARGWERSDDTTSVISLTGGIEHVEATLLAKNKRNERNRGLKRGATVSATRDPEKLAGFYELYTAACRVWRRQPVPLAFLTHLLDAAGGDAFLTCVEAEGRVVGGHFNLHRGRRMIAWLGATDPAHARTLFPATLAVWGDLVEACARGAEWVDLGGSGGVDTLRSFKKHFGAETQGRGVYVHASPLLRILHGGVSLVRRLSGRSTGVGPRVHDDRSATGGDG